jgi:hypothetical protein
LEQIHEEVFAEVSFHAAYEPMRCLRTKRWKYIRRFGDREKPVLVNIDDSLSKETWLEHGYGERSLDREELFDLVFDPGEAHNLASEPTMTPVLEELRMRLESWMAATEDPLLQGPLQAPVGARLNDPDGESPDEPTFTAE